MSSNVLRCISYGNNHIPTFVIHLPLYNYDIPVGSTKGITLPREDCRRGRSPRVTNLSHSGGGGGGLFLLYWPQGCHICVIIPNKIQNT